jgi:hypothetical protein
VAISGQQGVTCCCCSLLLAARFKVGLCYGRQRASGIDHDHFRKQMSGWERDGHSESISYKNPL